MDELLHHCLRELAFDGDLGSNVSRLRDFIFGFYTHVNALDDQNLDDAFCAYVWSLLIQQPTIIVGIVPEGITSEVWLAPQVSAKRKATARGEDVDSIPPPKLEIIPEHKSTPLGVLRQRYGERLRIAADPDAIFAAITGTHIRSPKLSPMVYTALQIITRGRDNGVSVVDLGKQSAYDQKTCFYLVRQLSEMDLVVKVRRGGVGTHFVIHKYFYDRSSSWKAIREEEEVDEEEADEVVSGNSKSLNFTPIDARHLSSYPLISRRVIKLLRFSKNHIHTSKDMLTTLGFPNPTKTDRRFFKTRINEMIQRGLIEKVIVPSNQKKPSSNASVKCFRLLSGDSNATGDDGSVLPDDENDLDAPEFVLQNGIKSNTSVHRQIIDLIEKSGTRGLTLNDLSSSLHEFDKRTIELLLARSEKSSPRPNLLDLHIVGIREFNGRERRHRYYTTQHYRQFVREEALDDDAAGLSNVDFSHVGGFANIDVDAFYETEQDMARFTDAFKVKYDDSETKKKKARVYKNPILPDGNVKRGRPRKHAALEKDDISTRIKRKRKVEEDAEDERKMLSKKTRITGNSSPPPLPVKRGRGRPPKTPKTLSSLNEKDVPSVEQRRGRKAIASSEELQGLHSLTTNNADEVTVQPTSHADMYPDDQMSLPGGLWPLATQSLTSTEDILSLDSVPNKECILSPSAIFTGLYTIPTNCIEEREQAESPSSFTNQVISRAQHLSPIPVFNSDTVNRKVESLQDSLVFGTRPPIAVPTLSSNGSRVNVSHLRRENEILRLLEKAGGIVAVHTKEFYEAHMNLLEELFQAGEPTSAPVGTKTDKRTMSSTFSTLENKGRVKQLKSSIITSTGLSRQANLVYLPDVQEAHLNAFLLDLGRAAHPQLPQLDSFVKIDEQLEFGAGPSVSRGLPPLQLLQMEDPGHNEKERWTKNIRRAKQLFTYDDATARDLFLMEKSTLAQSYGFIIGKALRCRQLHLSVLEAIESGAPSPNVVSKEKRIVEISFFLYDLPVDLYCSLVAPLDHDETLSALLASGDSRKTPMRDLPITVQNMLQVGRSRARARFLDMLEVLRALDLVTPLQPSKLSTPFIICSPHDQHPTEFDAAPLEGWTANTPAVAPSYWLFNESAPIYLWARSETDPPLLKNASVSRHQDSVEYWKDLQKACTDSETSVEIFAEGRPEILESKAGMARSFRRVVSWKSEYRLTWHQTQYLKHFLNSSVTTPLDLDAAEREAQVTRLSWVTAAPRDVIESFFVSHKEQFTKNVEKAKKKKKRFEEVRISLAKKSEAARLQREYEWSVLLTRCHPDKIPPPAAVRIERIHKQFLQTGHVKGADYWEKEIEAAVHETDLAGMKSLKLSRQPLPGPAPAPIAPPTSQSELAIDKLIEMQGPPINHSLHKRKRKRKEDGKHVEEQKKTVRRHRFQWTPDLDDLARDASVIIRARCRNSSRLDWAAFEQVFPAIPRNSVRQRLAHIKETPGNETYLRRLEDVWYDVWLKHRNTEALPDNNIQSASDFDLVSHIRFLRNHIDKQSLRVGLDQTMDRTVVLLPATIDQLQQAFDTIERERLAPDWDYMWNTLIEEGREKKLKHQVFSRCPAPFLPTSVSKTDEIAVAECAVKIVMGTPPERYNSEHASVMLKNHGDEVVNTATRNLVNAGVLSKLHRDPKRSHPGRSLKISESNQNAIGGGINQDTFQDAALLLEEMDTSGAGWHEWPLIATDGDCAALVQLVSENKVDFRIDTTDVQASRPALDWNSKKADDDNIETNISVQYHLDEEETSGRSESSMPLPPLDPTADGGHGTNEDGVSACCRRKSEQGLVDCSACVDEAWNVLNASLDANSRDAAERILRLTTQAKEHGVKKTEVIALKTLFNNVDWPALLNKLLASAIPQVYWVGYDSLVLISAHYLAKWSVIVSQNPLTYLFPRRWLDIQGQKVVDFWQAALRAVMSSIVFRPGISQSEIRWRLRFVYDRQEITDVLQYLMGENYLRVTVASNLSYDERETFFPYDEQEETQVIWFIGDKHWFQV